MSRRKVVKNELEERIEEAEVIMHWSGKRIVIATFLVILIIAGGLYAISLLSENPNAPKILGQRASDKPQLALPKEAQVEEIVEKAKEDLSNINARNIIASQPKIQQIINDLTSLTSSSRSAKDVICDVVCK